MLKKILPFLKTKADRIKENIEACIRTKSPEVLMLTEDQFWTLRAEKDSKIQSAFDASTELKDMTFEYVAKIGENQYKRIKVIVIGEDKKRKPVSYYDPIPASYLKGKK